MTDVHPSSAQLNDFLLGRLTDGVHAAIEAHLGTCAQCVADASGMTTVDTLAELLTAANTRLERERSLAGTPAPPHTAAGSDRTGAFDDGPALHGDEPVIPAGLADHPRYLLVRPLGAGGMGSVWLAQHQLLDRQVAIKVIRPELLSSTGAVERFRREARAVAKLSHPNIVAAFDAEESVGTHFLVMEYVAGESLADVLTRGPLSQDAACQVVRDAALGLGHAHAAGLAHRDIKPSNLIRTPEGLTKILDFGLATAELGSKEGLTGQNMVVGTPDYIAPEQAEESHRADARSDVYSLGCTLFHLLTGRVPFPGQSVLKKLDAHRLAERPVPANVPEELAALVARMLAIKPVERPTATETARTLEPFCVSVEPPPPRHPRRWPIAVGILLALVGLAAGGVVYKIKRDREEITIKTNDPDIDVVMRRNGERVSITDRKTNQTWELDTEKWRLTPVGGELSIELPDREALKIRRKGDLAVEITRTPTPVAPVPPPAQATGSTLKFELAYQIPFDYHGYADFSPDSRQFFVSRLDKGQWQAVFFDTEKSTELGRSPLPENFSRGWFLPGTTDLLVQVNNVLIRWDRKAGKKVADLLTLPGPGTFMAPSLSGKKFMQYLDNDPATNLPSAVISDLEAKKELFRARTLGGFVMCGMPCLSPDGTLLATLDGRPGRSVLRLWNTTTGKLVRSIDVAGQVQCSVAFRKAGKEVTADYWNGEAFLVGVWNVASGEQVRKTAMVEADQPAWRIHFSLDDVLIECPKSANGLVFMDTITGQRLPPFWVRGQMRIVVSSPDGRHLLLAAEKDLYVVRRVQGKSASKP